MKTILAAMEETRMEWPALGRALGAAGLILFLAGCATGPKYKVPAPPAAAGYTAAAFPAASRATTSTSSAAPWA